MSGYLAITSSTWCEYIKENRLDRAVYWCKKKTFRALKPGEPFYFLGYRLPSGDRLLTGKAYFDSFQVLSVAAAWNEYQNALGSDDYTDFCNRVKSIYKSDDCSLGCIVLKHPVFSSSKIGLLECGIYFSQYTVSGRIITEEECAVADSFIQAEL